MINFIKNLRNDKIMTKSDIDFISQLKMFALRQLAEQWSQRWNGEMLFVKSEVRLISPLSPSMSPPISDFLKQLPQGTDEERGLGEILTEMYPTQATWAPIRKTKPLVINENDGPTFSSPPIIDNHPTGNGYDSNNFGQYPPWYNNHIIHSPSSFAVYENDGPMSFNRSLSILGFDKSTDDKSFRRNTKRKPF